MNGAFSGTLAALSEGALHGVSFDTSRPGVHSGVLRIASTSQAAQDALFEVPITYEVVAALLPGDYNSDGVVDTADYAVWRDGGPLTNEGATVGFSTPEDYLVWRDNFGARLAVVATPEPGSVAMVIGAIMCFASRPRAGRGC